MLIQTLVINPTVAVYIKGERYEILPHYSIALIEVEKKAFSKHTNYG
jgi:hypothetical protein